MANEIDTKNHDDSLLKKGRHRKKQLYNSILQQMEFYFSDSNLSKDRFLSQLTQENPFVELGTFLKFNKIRKLTSNIEDIKKALKKSESLHLNEDGNSVGRKAPLKVKNNVEECTIYVERLKPDTTHEWLHTVFSEFGKVVYSSIPKFKHNSGIKGFAFIEFDKAEEAEKTLGFFESIGCKMPANSEPEELCSIKTFEENDKDGNVVMGEKRKLEDVEENVNKKKKFNDDENITKINEIEDEHEDSDSKKKKKLKKEHKKKAFFKELSLQVLSKKEWKKMRNRYLELQRQKMKEFKKHLHKAKFGRSNYDDKNKEMNKKEKQTDEEKVTENGIKEQNKKYDFVPGLIVKIKLKENVADFKKTKAEFRTVNDVQYVEVPHIGSEEIFLRFGTNENAKQFTAHNSASEITVLEGEEEKNYWDKIQNDRDEKMKRTQKKQRGRDKLLKKAKHFKFDE